MVTITHLLTPRMTDSTDDLLAHSVADIEKVIGGHLRGTRDTGSSTASAPKPITLGGSSKPAGRGRGGDDDDDPFADDD